MTTGISRPVVLLVEDEALVAMTAEDSLDVLGFESICAQTGAEALAALARTPDFAFAIIDVGLPDMRGYDLAFRIRERAPRLPIVMASGYDPESVSGHFSEEDGIVILAKPYGENDLREAIGSLKLNLA